MITVPIAILSYKRCSNGSHRARSPDIIVAEHAILFNPLFYDVEKRK